MVERQSEERRGGRNEVQHKDPKSVINHKRSSRNSGGDAREREKMSPSASEKTGERGK